VRYQTIIIGATAHIPESTSLPEVQEAIETLLKRVYNCDSYKVVVSPEPYMRPYGREWQEIPEPISGQVNGLDSFVGKLIARDHKGRALCKLHDNTLKIISEDWFVRRSLTPRTKPSVKSDKPSTVKTTKPIRREVDLTPYV